MEDSRYKIFRNFMVNELKITREDIVAWTEAAIEAVIARMIASGAINIEKLINSALDRQIAVVLNTGDLWTRDRLRDDIIRLAAQRLEVRVKS